MSPFLRYVSARFNREIEEEAYRIFITDLMGSYLGAKIRYYDIIHPPKEETRDPDEIINSIRDGLREL